MSGRALHLRPGTGGWAAGQVPGAVLLLALLGGCGEEGPVRLGEVVTVVASGASNPTVAAGEDGVFYVAWVGAGGGEADVWLARSEDGVVFSAPVRVNDVAGDAAPHEQAPAQVAVGSGGLVVVAWQNNRHEPGRRFPYSDVRLARSEDGGRTFSPAVTVNDDAGGPPSSHTFHDVAIGGSGEVVVSWIDSRERTRLESEVVVGPTVAPFSGSDAHTGHGGAGLPGPEIRVARSADGGRTFAPSLAVAVEACPCCRTSLEVGSAGVVAVAWRGAEPGDVRDVMVARSGAGGGPFGAPAVVHADGWRIDGCPHAGPALALDGGGRLHVAWYTGAAGREGLFYASAGPDGVFGAPTSLLGDGFVPVSQVKMAVAGEAVVMAWEDRRSGERTITVGRVGAGGSGPRIIASGMRGASPAVGGAGVAWLDEGAVRFVALGK